MTEPTAIGWRQRQREAAKLAADLLATRMLLRKGLGIPIDGAPESAPFWDRRSTLQALLELDVWASVEWADERSPGTCPTFLAIFEISRPVIAPDDGEFLDEHGLRTPKRVDMPVGDGGDPEGLEKMVRVSSDKPDSPERIIHLAVRRAMAGRGLQSYRQVLLEFFPRTGPHTAAWTFAPGDMDEVDQAVVRRAVHAIKDSWRKIEKVKRR